MRDVQDELESPSGPLFKDCEDAPDNECCRTLQSFHVNADNYDDPSITSCSGVCAFLGRDGSDGACMPENPQCDNWVSKDKWPVDSTGKTYSRGAKAWCMCSGKSRGRQPVFTSFAGVSNVPKSQRLSNSVPAGSASTTSAGEDTPSWPEVWPGSDKNPYNTGGRRMLGNETFGRRLDAYDGRWHWSEPNIKGVDPFHGDHLDLSDTCLRDLYNYRLQNVQANSSGYDYHTLTSPPFSSWSATNSTLAHGVLDCRNETVETTDTCVVAKGLFSASRVYLWTAQEVQKTSFMQSYGASYSIGRQVYQDNGATLGSFDQDVDSTGQYRQYGDVLIGNRLFLSSQRGGSSVLGDYSQTNGIRVGSRDFSHVWAGDLDGIAPDDIIGRHADDGSVAVYIGYLDQSARNPNNGIGLGFRYGGEIVSKNAGYTVTTVSFMNTIAGYGTDCRGGGAFGCVTFQKAIFIGTGAGAGDLIWTTAGSSHPFRAVFVNTEGQTCPLASNGVDITLPVRSYEACVAASEHLKIDTPFELNTLDLPLHSCVYLDSVGQAALAADRNLVWNRGVDTHPDWVGYPQDLRSLTWLRTATTETVEQIIDGVTVTNTVDRYTYHANLVCLEPEANFQQYAPPAPPNQATQRYKTTPVVNCGMVQSPCDCCRAYQRDDAGNTVDCAPPAQGSLWMVNGVASSTCLAYDEAAINRNATADCEVILQYCDSQTTSKVFSPMQGAKYNTLCSAAFHTDINQQYQAIVVGTAAGSANNLIYLAHADVNRRELTDTLDEEAVAVAAERVDGSANLICFANSNAKVCTKQ